MTLISDIYSNNWSLDKGVQGSVVQGAQDINQCVSIILTTIKGSDPWRPTFGCGIFEYMDKPINSVVPSIIGEVKKSLQLWEPRITVESVVVSFDAEQVTVNITYKIKNTVIAGQTQIVYGLS